MKKEEKKKGSTAIPLVIIGLVLVGVVAAAWWFSRSSKPPTNSNGNQNGVNATRTPQIPANAPVGANPPNMLGSPTSPVTVEEFADFQCGSCAATHPTMKEIQSTYGSKIKFVFRNYPLSIPAHDKAFEAAMAAEAAGMQGKFWAMQDQLFQNQQAWTQNPSYKELWAGYAEKIGLDLQRFQTDASGMGARSRVEQDRSRGSALNVSSTPTIFVNGQSVPYPEANVAGLRRIIDAELQKASASQTQPGAAAPASSSAANSSNSK